MVEIVITVLKYAGMLLTGMFGVLGLLVEFKKDGVITKQGRTALALILVSTIMAIVSQTFELFRDQQQRLSRGKRSETSAA